MRISPARLPALFTALHVKYKYVICFTLVKHQDNSMPVLVSTSAMWKRKFPSKLLARTTLTLLFLYIIILPATPSTVWQLLDFLSHPRTLSSEKLKKNALYSNLELLSPQDLTNSFRIFHKYVTRFSSSFIILFIYLFAFVYLFI